VTFYKEQLPMTDPKDQNLEKSKDTEKQFIVLCTSGFEKIANG
jgi:hypothetical protein